VRSRRSLGIDLFPLRWNLGLSAAARMHFSPGVESNFGALELGMSWRFGVR
jgi:hypothetical protein